MKDTTQTRKTTPMDKYLVFDGETCNTPKINGQLDTSSGQVYDLGGMVIDQNANEYERFSLVNEDVFFGLKEAMREAYYADKIPQYMRDIWQKKRQTVNTWEMWKLFNDLIKKHDIKAVVAHNIWFDIHTLNATMRYQTKSKKRFFLPYNMPLMDTMRMAEKTICKRPEYIKFCEENNYMTSHPIPQPRKTAEILWRFLSGDNTFEESHTGLEDVEIEAKIFAECMKELKG